MTKRYTVIEEDTCDGGLCYLMLLVLLVGVLPFAAIYGLILLCARSCCRPCCMENCPGLECCWGPSCLCIDAVPTRTVAVAPAPAPKQDITVNQIMVNQNQHMQMAPAAYPPTNYGMGVHPVGYGPQQPQLAGVHGAPVMGAYGNPAAMPSTSVPQPAPAAMPSAYVPQPAAMPHPNVPTEPPPTYTK